MSEASYFRPKHEIQGLYLPQLGTQDLSFRSLDCKYSIYSTTPSISTFFPNDPPTIRLSNDSPNMDDEFNQKLRELENVMLGPDTDTLETYDLGIWKQMNEAILGGDLKSVLIATAKAVSENDFLTSQWLFSELRQMVSISGEPMQRLGACFLEGFVSRLASSRSTIYKTIRTEEPENSKCLSYPQILYEICPYFKFGYMSANGAIAEAMKNEKKVHIIDFDIGQGSQWVPLILGFAARPGGPPHIRITGIGNATTPYAHGGGLSVVGQRLCRLAESFNVPFEFYGATMSAADVALNNLDIRPGEGLAVNFAFVLHHVPDESLVAQNHRDRILRLVKCLSPKVVTLVELECNTNSSFLPRFLEALDYYRAIFESIDATLPRDHKDRINVEQHCLKREIMNVTVTEGIERVERHECLGKWKSRFAKAGFKPYPLSSFVNATIITLLKNYSDRYRVEERDGALYLGWMDKDLVACCAWK